MVVAMTGNELIRLLDAIKTRRWEGDGPFKGKAVVSLNDMMEVLGVAAKRLDIDNHYIPEVSDPRIHIRGLPTPPQETPS